MEKKCSQDIQLLLQTFSTTLPLTNGSVILLYSQSKKKDPIRRKVCYFVATQNKVKNVFQANGIEYEDVYVSARVSAVVRKFRSLLSHVDRNYYKIASYLQETFFYIRRNKIVEQVEHNCAGDTTEYLIEVSSEITGETLQEVSSNVIISRAGICKSCDKYRKKIRTLDKQLDDCRKKHGHLILNGVMKKDRDRKIKIIGTLQRENRKYKLEVERLENLNKVLMNKMALR